LRRASIRTTRKSFNQFYEAQDGSENASLRRPCDLARPRAVFTGSPSLPHRGDQRRAHVNPLFAGGTLFAWSEVLDKAEIPPKRHRRAALRSSRQRTACAEFPLTGADGKPDRQCCDLDYWAVMPR